MIVLDASVVVEILLNSPITERLHQALLEQDQPILVPHLLDLEVASALRGLASAHRLDAYHVKQILQALADLPAERYSHTPLLERIWELRHNFSAYDAAYIALAEATDSVLYTTDLKLSRGHRAQVVVIA